VEITTVGWVLTIGVIAALLAFDLLLATLRPHAVGYPEATLWSVLYIAPAVAFGLVFASIVGGDTAPSTSLATSWRRACPSTISSSS
jgi:tellurite resistance protein TerC